MQAKDLEALHSIKSVLDNTPTVPPSRIDNPTQAVESSLVSFLTHRLEKLREGSEFEDEIKQAILARIPEAEFRDLGSLLDLVQRNNNVATEKVLAPFISQNGSPSPLLPQQALPGADAQNLLKDQDEKKVLQALTALNQLMEIVKNTTDTTP